MSSQVSSDARLVSNKDDLRRYILDGSKPIGKWVVGTEHEKFGWRLKDASPVDYFGQVESATYYMPLRRLVGQTKPTTQTFSP